MGSGLYHCKMKAKCLGSLSRISVQIRISYTNLHVYEKVLCRIPIPRK